jgi:hypothetical protein
MDLSRILDDSSIPSSEMMAKQDCFDFGFQSFRSIVLPFPKILFGRSKNLPSPKSYFSVISNQSAFRTTGTGSRPCNPVIFPQSICFPCVDLHPPRLDIFVIKDLRIKNTIPSEYTRRVYGAGPWLALGRAFYSIQNTTIGMQRWHGWSVQFPGPVSHSGI